MLGPIQISDVGMGCMGLSQGYGPADDATSRRAIDAAYDGGIRMFDTAMSYGIGHNEELVGGALAHQPDAFIATKFGIARGPEGVRLDADPRRIRQYCEESLRRLRRDRIDLYYLHRVDPAFALTDQIAAMSELRDAGLVRYLGVSEVTAAQLREAAAVVPIAAVQLEWSLTWRRPEADVVPTAAELGVGVVAYSPLGRGLLGGSASADPSTSDFRGGDPRYQGDSYSANLETAHELTRIAEPLGITTAQLALAWLLARSPHVVPIPGSRDPERMRRNAAAAGIELTAQTVRRLDEMSAGFRGDRASFAAPATSRAG